MYVPGDKLKMIEKVLTLPADESPDIAVLDLEDGVGVENKDLARNNIYSIIESGKLKTNNHTTFAIRLNGFPFKKMLESDLDTVAECLKVSNYEYPKVINLSKVQNKNELIKVDNSFLENDHLLKV